MAIINCIECGKKFSNLAVACPKCAAPTTCSTGKLINAEVDQFNNEISTLKNKYSAFDLLETDTCNKVMDYYWSLHHEIERLGGSKPKYPEFDKETIVRAVVTRMVDTSRMLLTTSPITGKPQVSFIPNNCWILSSDNIAKIIGDHEGPEKNLLPDIIQAAVSRLAK